MLTRHEPGRHTTVTSATVTVRRPGEPTEHREIDLAELRELLSQLAVGLTVDEENRLLAKLDERRRASG
jgi:N-hydroxyarylamine O-acetyltransferase